MADAPKLVVVTGPLAGRVFTVGPGGLRLGRSSGCDIHIVDEQLSRNHCYFEADGETGLRVTDLASANGTFVNGVPLGSEPYELSDGDVIETGDQRLKVGLLVQQEIPPPSPAADKGVDLGLGNTPPALGSYRENKSEHARSSFVNLLIIVASSVCIVMIVLLLGSKVDILGRFKESGGEVTAEKISRVKDEVPVVREVVYEKVEGNQSRIFRYEMTYSPDSVLSVRIDDVPDENRHHVKNSPLRPEAIEELNDILAWKNLKDLDPEYIGMTPDPPALESWSLKVVYSTCVKSVRVVNMNEPEAFRAVREKLEAFSKSELGVWAIQYSRGKLLELAEKSVELGEAKWFDRDVEHGNLAASVTAYEEALFYLETINPKPPLAATAREGLERSKSLLGERAKEQRFLADRALNLARWNEAKKELLTLLEMVPDRRDDRHRDAKEKLITVERHIKRESGR